MAVGQVSFKDNKKVTALVRPSHHPKPADTAQVKRLVIPQRENVIVNRLNKTKEERHPDLRQEKEDRLKQLRKKDQAAQQLRVSMPPHLPISRDTRIDRSPEKRRSPHLQGAPGEKVAKGPRLRRHLHRGSHGLDQQPGPRRELGG